MEELWNITIFLQLAIIENIRDICEKIYISCLEKYKAESIIERLVEQKESNQVIFKSRKMNYASDMQFAFIEHLSYKLKKMGKQALPYLDVLEEEVRKMGMTLSDVIRKEHFDLALKRVSMGNAIRSLKELSNMNLETMFEQINEVEEILKKDPSGIYEKMDYKTKILYRNKIEAISKKTRISEIYIANKVIELCKNKEDISKFNELSAAR